MLAVNTTYMESFVALD